MAKFSGLALIQSTVSAIGLLLTSIVWDKWEKCHVTKNNRTVIYRTGLWDKCVDHHLLQKTVCSSLPEQEKSESLKSVTSLMISSLLLQILCVLLGLLVYRYGKHRKLIFTPLLVNVAAAVTGGVGLSMYTYHHKNMNCELSSSYIMGWLGVVEALLCCLFFSFVAFGK